MDLEHSTNSFYRASNAIPGPHFVNKRIFLQMTAKLSSKVPRNLPDVVINRPRNKKEATPVARPPGGVSRAILYFRGLGRQAIRHLRLFFDKLRIPKEAIQFVSFIGENVAEVILWNHFREDVVTRLATAKVQLDPTFDPLSSRSFTNASTIERLGLATKSEGEKSKVARKAFVSRLDSMLQTISGHRRGLRSFLRSLKRAVKVGAPIERFFNPAS